MSLFGQLAVDSLLGGQTEFLTPGIEVLFDLARRRRRGTELAQRRGGPRCEQASKADQNIVYADERGTMISESRVMRARDDIHRDRRRGLPARVIAKGRSRMPVMRKKVE